MKISKIVIVSLMAGVWLITQADSAQAKTRGKGRGQRVTDIINKPIISLDFDLDNQVKNTISNVSFDCGGASACPVFSAEIELSSGSFVNVGTQKSIVYEYVDTNTGSNDVLTLVLPLCDPTICSNSSPPSFPYNKTLKDNVLFYPYEIKSVPDGLEDITILDEPGSLPPFFASPNGEPEGFVLFTIAYNSSSFSADEFDTYIPRATDPIPEPSTVAGWLLLGGLSLKQLLKK